MRIAQGIRSSSVRKAVPVALTSAAMLAFAANSVLTRLGLGTDRADAWSFTALRVGSGALTLGTLSFVSTRLAAARRRSSRTPVSSWASAAWLVLYALPFSLAYVRLDAGTGALLLFGAVQLTMIMHGLRSGERPGVLSWLGLIGAASGVVYLVSPGVSAPDPVSALVMVVAGIGWGRYSVSARGVVDALGATSVNFRRAAYLLAPLTAAAWPWWSISTEGVALALASGCVASGLGYVVWYVALAHLSSTQAALVQLAVPVLAAVGGVIWIGEALTARLLLASGVILGSIALGVIGRTS